VARQGTTPRRPRAAVGARREREVLDAAAKVFAARGYSDASVQDIADELGILKGSLYHYIDSKEDLLFRLLMEAHDEVEAILVDVQAAEGLAPLERLRLYITRQVEYTSRNLAKMSIYYHDIDQLSPASRKELMRKRRLHERFVTGLIAEAQERGEVDASVDTALVTNFVFGSMIWVYRWFRPGGKVGTASLAASCADFVLHGIAGRR
jgi:TetR/AcrR family transcriptional regulator, cholesterol catabolism regulator